MNLVFLIDSYGVFDILYQNENGSVVEKIFVRNAETKKYDKINSLGVWNSKEKKIENIDFDGILNVQKISSDWRIYDEIPA